jgi:outer membrane putative beta-barrel porin/alpha-amylase
MCQKMGRFVSVPAGTGVIVLAMFLGIFGRCGPARADLALETESARLLPPGKWELSAAFEFQTASDGKEYATPLAIAVGLMERMELLIEPVPYVKIAPSDESGAHGVGDTEITLQYLLVKEQPNIPAIAIAGEIKIPTARAKIIGSGKFDYRIYAIASKRFVDVDVHFNVGFNIIGEPTGVKTRNPWDVSLAAEWFVHPKFDIIGEITYVGSGLRSEDPNIDVTPEIAGEEIVYSAGVRYHVSKDWDVFGTFSYDNQDAKLYRVGLSFKF